MKKKTKISTLDIYVLHTISILNDKDLYPNNDGIYKILIGLYDKETMNFINEKVFGSYNTYKSKRITCSINRLVKKDYINTIYDEKTKSMFYRLSFKGNELLKSLDIEKIKLRTKKVKSSIVSIKN